MSDEPTPEQRQLLESLAGSVRRDLAAGVDREQVVRGLTARGLSSAAAERLVQDAEPVTPEPATGSRDLFVVNLPPEADPSAMAGAPPLGRRAEVTARLGEVFESVKLDPEGRGRLAGAGYAIEVDIGLEDPVTLVSLEVQGGQPAVAVVRRLSEATGWRVLDRSADKLFDMPGKRPAVAPAAQPVPAAPRPRPAAAARAPAPKAPGRSRTDSTVRLVAPARSSAGRFPARLAAAGLGVALLVAAAFTAARTSLVGSIHEANEARALVDVLDFARAEEVFAAANLGGFAPPEVVADPSRYASVLDTGKPLGSLVAPRFLRDQRDGYRFEFRPRPDSASLEAPVKPAFRAFAYLAVPLDPGRSGCRSFAYYSDLGRTVFARDDGQPPTGDEPPLVRLP